MAPRFIANELAQLVVGVVIRAGQFLLLDEPESLQPPVHAADEFHAAHHRIEVGIARPTIACSSWMHDLAGKGIVWYPIKRMLTVGSPDVADTDYMAETCDLTDGTQELYVEDGGEMPYGDGTCTKEEQAGWKAEATPGPLALAAQA